MSNERDRAWIAYCEKHREVTPSHVYPLVKAAFMAAWEQAYHIRDFTR